MATCVEHSLQEITASEIVQNAAPARLYELAVSEEGAAIVASGALATYSGEKTGRSPKDKRIVENPESKGDVWWGSVNMPVSPESFTKCRQQAIKFINGRKRVYVVDGYAGWDHEYRVKVRVISTLGLPRPVHAQHDDPAQPGGAEDLRRARLRDLQRRRDGRRQADPGDHVDRQRHARPRAEGDGDPRQQVRRRDEEGHLHGDELLDAQAGRAVDALHAPTRARGAT